MYNLANTFKASFDINVCDATLTFLNSEVKTHFKNLTEDEKSHYVTYSLKLANSLREYIPHICGFEYNDDLDSKKIYDFKLRSSKKNSTRLVSLTFSNIGVSDIIPRKLMKICKYRKNTNVYNEYMPVYDEICKIAYERIIDSEKYSELSSHVKQKYLYDPIIDLFISTLSKKRKCVESLYNHLFHESDRILFKIDKRKFSMYDFGIELSEPDVKSFRIDKIQTESDTTDGICLTFNNKVTFDLILRPNTSSISEFISLKFRTKISNINDLYRIKYDSVIPK